MNEFSFYDRSLTVQKAEQSGDCSAFFQVSVHSRLREKRRWAERRPGREKREEKEKMKKEV
ncbi:MAG: hypothetical protein MJ074_09530 [Oscillospiraceae bacterium]|nr:hypothetical protein [Oscillospiraceae bacterium]